MPKTEQSGFEKYRVIQDKAYQSDFDKLLENTENITQKK